MSKRDELDKFLELKTYGRLTGTLVHMIIEAAKEEALAEIRAELDAQSTKIYHRIDGIEDLKTQIQVFGARFAAWVAVPSPPPSGGVGGAAPAADRITVSSEMADIVAAEATIDGKRYTMRGMPPPGARSVDLYHEVGGPAPACARCGARPGDKIRCMDCEPAPVPYQEPFSWCKGCGMPIGRDDRHTLCPGVFISCPPYTGGPAPSPDTAPAAEPPQAPGGLATMEELRSWMKAHGASELRPEPPLVYIDDSREVKRLRAALREIRDTPTKLAASDGTTLIRMRRIAVEALTE